MDQIENFLEIHEDLKIPFQQNRNLLGPYKKGLGIC
jgi:hypothetical protein